MQLTSKRGMAIMATTISLLHREPVRTKDVLHIAFCKFFCAAMNDLMLKVLIVCAIISIVVSMIFEADHRSTGKFE
ncbi:MAG: hypothetical protein COA94_08755 [Rickettsiales bacterium]|nr:MAG: hypothetical protein COA94_08755 [Rickettsiales bacterium]